MTGISRAFERHLLVAVDAVGYGRGSDQDHFAMQSGIKTVLHDAAIAAKLDRDRWVRQKAGDGELAILPLDEPEPLVVDAYARQLDLRLSSHNASLPAERRIRLRMAIHFGAAMPAENGYAGQGVVAVSRLVDSSPVRDALTAAPDATLVLALTRQVYNDVVRQGHVSFSAADFTRMLVQMKEFQDEAWVKVFGPPTVAPPPAAAPPTTDKQGEPASGSPEPAAVVVTQNFDRTDARGAVFGVSYGRPGGNLWRRKHRGARILRQSWIRLRIAAVPRSQTRSGGRGPSRSPGPKATRATPVGAEPRVTRPGISSSRSSATRTRAALFSGSARPGRPSPNHACTAGWRRRRSPS